MWTVISKNSSACWLEMNFIHLDGMLEKTSTPYMSTKSLQQVHRDENTDKFLPGKLDKEVISPVCLVASSLQLITDFLCIFLNTHF